MSSILDFTCLRIVRGYTVSMVHLCKQENVKVAWGLLRLTASSPQLFSNLQEVNGCVVALSKICIVRRNICKPQWKKEKTWLYKYSFLNLLTNEIHIWFFTMDIGLLVEPWPSASFKRNSFSKDLWTATFEYTSRYHAGWSLYPKAEATDHEHDEVCYLVLMTIIIAIKCQKREMEKHTRENHCNQSLLLKC